jgi:hypothetical protein
MLKFILLSYLIQYVSAHADRLVKNQIRSFANNDLPQILSYHIHCLFVNSNSDQVKNAMMLYYEFQNQFNLTSSPLCKNLFDEKRLCMFGKDS